jgi:hypothetical protein
LGTSWLTINNKGKQIFETINNFKFNKIKKKLPYKNMIHHPTVMFRNEKGIRYREKFLYAQDRDFWLRLLSNNKKMRVIPVPLIKWRTNKSSVSIKKAFMQNFFVKKSIEFYFQRLKLGFDYYSKFDPLNELKEFNKHIVNQYNLKEKLVLYFKENIVKGSYFRKELIKYWKKYGYFSWKESGIYYLISYMPKGIIIFLNKFINKIYN